MMHKFRWLIPPGLLLLAAGWIVGADAGKVDSKDVLTGQQAFADFRSIKPGLLHKITAADLPKPYETKSSANFPRIVPKPDNMWPQAPAGFKVELYAHEGLTEPRQMRIAPNGDFFVADSKAGEIKILRGRGKDGKPEQVSTFAGGLKQPFGVNFYPVGANPQWVYVGNFGSLVRFPYHNGDLKTTGPAESVVMELPTKGSTGQFHWTRDVIFSKDGKRMFVAVGSGSNVDDSDTHPDEFHRADILEYTPEGKFVQIYGVGIRNAVGLAINPQTGELWCSVNERDELGDNLVPDYITHVQEGGFYGWPWYYIGGHQDPRHEGKHPELKDKVIVPDVLLQPHNASLGIIFYEGNQFPKEYRGDLFAAEHGSWNRSVRSGYELIRVPLENGHASGVYQDFITGFVTPDGNAWGRPVAVAVARDGSLYFTDDGYKAIWRVSYTGK
jgi:glucose/arabinose dehydrogenase